MKALAFLLLRCSGVVHAQTNNVAAWTDTYIAGLAPARHFRGNILVVKNGDVVVRESYGLADESWKVSNVTGSRFEIASVTKQFTAVAILQLAEAKTFGARSSQQVLSAGPLPLGKALRSNSFLPIPQGCRTTK